MHEQICLASKTGESLTLKGLEVSACIAGLLAETTLRQRYRNDADTNLELSYTFPLPVGAVLMGFTARIGERAYRGEVLPRRQAEAKYEDAVEGGQTAFRLQMLRDGVYNASLGNVLPGEDVAIDIEYAEALAWNADGARYRLPTTLAPRYGAPLGMSPWQQPETSLAVEYPLTIAVKIKGAPHHITVACPSHKTSVRREDDTLVIELLAGAVMDRDFVLDIRRPGACSLATVATALDTHVAMVTIMPPRQPDQEGSARAKVIVLDCSGSMAGDSIALAKEGVQLALGSLLPSEQMGVIGFGTDYQQFDRSLQPATPQNIERARGFVARLGSMGGTEIAAALNAALAYSTDTPVDILLLTDGETWDIGDIVTRAQAAGVRIFTLGIGTAVAEDIVLGLAERTGGARELVAPNEDMAERIARHFERMRQPHVAQVNIAWPRPPCWEVRPTREIFAGDAYTVYAGFDAPTSGQMATRVSFTDAQDVLTETVQLEVASEALATTVVRMAAASRVHGIPKEERTEWAVRYQLVTKGTDYLVTLVREATERQSELPTLAVVPQMLPAGWGGMGTVANRPPRASSIDASGLASAEIPGFIGSGNARFDIPTVLRRSAPRAEAPRRRTPSVASDAGFLTFLQKLKRRAERLMFGELPRSREGLVHVQCPAQLIAKLDELVAEGHPEREVLAAFYTALSVHPSGTHLGANFDKQLAELLAAAKPAPLLVERFREVLDLLWHPAEAPVEADSYMIPRFLLRDAD